LFWLLFGGFSVSHFLLIAHFSPIINVAFHRAQYSRLVSKIPGFLGLLANSCFFGLFYLAFLLGFLAKGYGWRSVGAFVTIIRQQPVWFNY